MPQGNDCLTNGLVGWWPLNGNANDTSGNKNDGAITGAALTTGKNNVANSAYSFNGSSYINLGNATSLNSPNITFSAWIKPSTVTGLQEVIAKESQYKYRLDGGNIDVLVGKLGAGWTVNQNFVIGFQAGSWYNIVCTIDSISNIISIYNNGALVGSRGLNGGITAYNTNSTFLGTHTSNGSEMFNGTIDDARIYSRVLSASEISALYDAGAQ